MPQFQHDGLADFLAMGDYAIYVWPVYLLFAAFFILTVVPPLHSRKQLLKQLKARMEREDSA